MNKIKILHESVTSVPEGTTLEAYSKRDKSLNHKTFKQINIYHENFFYEVDFSNIKPSYPHKGMIVPKEGIEFADGEGKLIDVGLHGFTWVNSENQKNYVKYMNIPHEIDKLKQTLPKTIEVCKDCFKEVCECKQKIDVDYHRKNLKKLFDNLDFYTKDEYVRYLNSLINIADIGINNPVPEGR